MECSFCGAFRLIRCTCLPLHVVWSTNAAARYFSTPAFSLRVPKKSIAVDVNLFQALFARRSKRLTVGSSLSGLLCMQHNNLDGLQQLCINAQVQFCFFFFVDFLFMGISE